MKYGKYLTIAAFALALTSCLKDDDDNSDWRTLNDAYVAAAQIQEENGVKTFTEVKPIWAPDSYILMRWHNDREKTSGNLSPLDNSTVNVIYSVTDIKGNMIDNSYASTVYGDSIYQTQPCKNIVGFWAALTQMKVGDKTTVIVPYTAGYGTVDYGAIPAYSTLVYNIELRSIPAFQVNR